MTGSYVPGVLALTVALTLSACSSDSSASPVSPSAPEVAKLRVSARQVLNSRLDRTVRTAGLTKRIGRSGLDRCRRGNDDDKNDEHFSAKCALTLYRAYVWNGDVDAFLDRFHGCPSAVAEIRHYWHEFGGKPAPRNGSHPYDAGDLPEFVCDGVTMEFAASSAADLDLESLPGARVWDPDGGMYEPYHWAAEGKPWLNDWVSIRDRGRFLIAMETSQDYWLLKSG
ncbi:hypothetical protein [Microtetraspora sp. NBRC 16547]|uniref:hypothetical protein n=1 Tax=Microtetraspora sp. NBRC 16547 TaxID=3030993 RepID=UPI0024A08EF8|nr:hypothetical protein [Microtetraspora sp. NBRC 16547]GLX02716.1 hypothetical protein Misp02_68020 [Microtetraspora sp. NBRC 16547]